MQKVREAISDIINDLKSYNLDDKFSFRFLSNKLKDKIQTLLKQDADSRTLFNINEVWMPLSRIELKDYVLDVASDFYDYTDVLKVSRKRIPDVYTTKYGNLIKILNVNSSLEYKQIKSFEYKDIKNREHYNKKIKYFWIEDGYLFIPDTTIEEVRAVGMFKDYQEVEIFNGSCDECAKPLDSVLLVPDYILDIAKTQVVQMLASITKQMIEDEKPNLDNLQKTNP